MTSRELCRSLPMVILAMGMIVACSEVDPRAERQSARAAHEAAVVSFSSRADGTVLVELEVRSSVGPSLEALTVAVRQHDADTEILRSERVTLDIGDMDATGVMRVYATVEAADGVEVFSSLVEHDLDEATLRNLPEMSAAGD